VNRVSHLRDGTITTFELDPRDLGIPRADLSDLAGGTPEQNAGILRDILAGEDTGPRRDIVLLNAAAALAAADGDWDQALARARHSIDSGAALARLDAFVAYTQKLA
ncbi:MAG: anthranilate phosphoribosyltransferase, partial [Caldilineae bacterium]